MNDLTNDQQFVALLSQKFAGIRDAVLQTSDGNRSELRVEFDQSEDGYIAYLVFIQISKSLKLVLSKRDNSGDFPSAITLATNKATIRKVCRHWVYASGLVLNRPRPPATVNPRPFSAQLSHALQALDSLYASIQTQRDAPIAAVYLNLLAHLDDDQRIEMKDLPQEAIVSKRVLRVLLNSLEKSGWIAKTRDPESLRRTYISLTPQGMIFRDAAAAQLNEVETVVAHQLGNETYDSLREALIEIAASSEIALPQYIAGYGVADASLFGGGSEGEDQGPPYIPSHGQDFPVVIRPDTKSIRHLPLVSLISRVLSLFTLAYERKCMGSLGVATVFMKHLKDTHCDLDIARQYGVKGNYKSGMERHLVVVVEPKDDRRKSRRVYLTPKGQIIRTSYPAVMSEIESAWEEQFGNQRITRLRERLDGLLNIQPGAYDDYPDTTRWLLAPHRAAHQIASHFATANEVWGSISTSAHAGITFKNLRSLPSAR